MTNANRTRSRLQFLLLATVALGCSAASLSGTLAVLALQGAAA